MHTYECLEQPAAGHCAKCVVHDAVLRLAELLGRILVPHRIPGAMHGVGLGDDHHSQRMCALALLLLLLLLLPVVVVSRDSQQCATVAGLLPPRHWAANGACRVRHVDLPSLERQVLVPHVPQHAADQGDKYVLAAAVAAVVAGVKQASQAACRLMFTREPGRRWPPEAAGRQLGLLVRGSARTAARGAALGEARGGRRQCG